MHTCMFVLVDALTFTHTHSRACGVLPMEVTLAPEHLAFPSQRQAPRVGGVGTRGGCWLHAGAVCQEEPACPRPGAGSGEVLRGALGGAVWPRLTGGLKETWTAPPFPHGDWLPATEPASCPPGAHLSSVAPKPADTEGNARRQRQRRCGTLPVPRRLRSGRPGPVTLHPRVSTKSSSCRGHRRLRASLKRDSRLGPVRVPGRPGHPSPRASGSQCCCLVPASRWRLTRRCPHGCASSCLPVWRPAASHGHVLLRTVRGSSGDLPSVASRGLPRTLRPPDLRCAGRRGCASAHPRAVPPRTHPRGLHWQHRHGVCVVFNLLLSGCGVYF